VVLLSLCSAAAAVQLYGAAPGAFGGVDDVYVCDGDRTLPVSRLNDDYCDCADGSDEPGEPYC
jgi:protein kinase C substrate 80K-H